MKPSAFKVLFLLLLFVGAAFAGHWVTLEIIPKKAMQTVIDRAGQSGERENVLIHAPPVTPNSRRVVRPSPDLIYSICVYDLDEGPIKLSLTPSDHYASLSLYDDKTNNFFVENNIGRQGKVLSVIVSKTENTLGSAKTVTSPSMKGVALIRRAAATAEQLQNSMEARNYDFCSPV
ncbi:MAG: DUF1254 domain-containing protein [Pseudomonadota bacterium]